MEIVLFNSEEWPHCFTHSSCTILHYHQQCSRVIISPLPCQYLLFLLFLIIGILLSVKWYLVLWCWHFHNKQWWCRASFHVLLAICIYSLEKVYLSPSPVFQLCWVILFLSCGSSLYILVINPFADTGFQNIFCLFMYSIFTCLKTLYGL